MSIFKFFNSTYQKLRWIINFVYVYISPIYSELVKIIKEVKTTDLKDEEARKAVFQRISDFVQKSGLKISDSILNCAIELAYQLIKRGKE